MISRVFLKEKKPKYNTFLGANVKNELFFGKFFTAFMLKKCELIRCDLFNRFTVWSFKNWLIRWCSFCGWIKPTKVSERYNGIDDPKTACYISTLMTKIDWESVIYSLFFLNSKNTFWFRFYILFFQHVARCSRMIFYWLDFLFFFWKKKQQNYIRLIEKMHMERGSCCSVCIQRETRILTKLVTVLCWITVPYNTIQYTQQ